MQFKDDDRFDEAFCFDEAAPDMLGVAAVIEGKIVGMAGASADSTLSWQIGICDTVVMKRKQLIEQSLFTDPRPM